MAYILKLQDDTKARVGRYQGKPLYYVDQCDGDAYWEFLVGLARHFDASHEAFEVLAREHASRPFKRDRFFVMDLVTNTEEEIFLDELEKVRPHWEAVLEREDQTRLKKIKDADRLKELEGATADVPAVVAEVLLHDEIAGMTEGTTFFQP